MELKQNKGHDPDLVGDNGGTMKGCPLTSK